MEIADVEKSAAYKALKLSGGRFSHLLVKMGDLIGLKPDESELPPEDE